MGPATALKLTLQGLGDLHACLAALGVAADGVERCLAAQRLLRHDATAPVPERSPATPYDRRALETLLAEQPDEEAARRLAVRLPRSIESFAGAPDAKRRRRAKPTAPCSAPGL